MRVGRWEGEYIDIEGHRAKVLFTIKETGAEISGDFEMTLSTEDRPERYRGTLTGTAKGDGVVLRLNIGRGEPMICTLTLREPAAYSEQAVVGVVDPAPSLKLGGGALIAWKFKRR